MKKEEYVKKVRKLFKAQEAVLYRKNQRLKEGNGIYDKYKFPVITNRHTPLFWRYDLNPSGNPHLMERMGINSTFNPGAIYLKGKFYLVVRVEGWDRKSFFAVAESKNGIDNFIFHDYPMLIPQYGQPDTNVYDMRLVEHQDGWIYGLFCTERKDPSAKEGDEQSAVAQCGIIRSRDMLNWERLPDLVTPSPQQRNCVLHPEFVDGKYAFYTRPQESFLDPGKEGGIGWGLSDSITNAEIGKEIIIETKKYHTVYELKNGQGPAPIKANSGWLHLAHGTRQTPAGMRYVLFMFVTDLKEPWKVIKRPGGYFLAPEGEERIGDVSNVVFSNGWIKTANNKVYIYYASSDTRIHVATTTVASLEDYVWNTPEDEYTSIKCVEKRLPLIKNNLKFMKKLRIRKL